jgi:quinol monooxygenase YgiN
MITRIVKVKLEEKHLNRFKEYIPAFLNKVRLYSNNYHADSFSDLEDKHNYHIYTIWKTEDALNKFRESDINLEFKKNILEWSSTRFSAWTVEND